MKWGIHNLKHKELYEWYNNQPEPKVKRAKFSSRVIQYWYSKEDAIKDIDYLKLGKRKRYWTIVEENWRVCSRCKQFKEWNMFARTKDGINGRTSNCKQCRNEMKREYRLKTWYAKDHEYKKNKRVLSIWDQIYFQDDVWEVLDYKHKKWYTVKSILNWTEKKISTMDNHYSINNSCVRFTKLKSLLRVKTTEQLEIEKQLQEENKILYE